LGFAAGVGAMGWVVYWVANALRERSEEAKSNPMVDA